MIKKITDHGPRTPRSGRRGQPHRAFQVVIKRNTCDTKKQIQNIKSGIRIGTWNVRSLYKPGKAHNTIREIKRLNIATLGISEMR